MEKPKLEWESAEAKKQREVREANRAMDERTAGCFEMSWEEDPSVHHDHDSSERPFRLRGNSVSQGTDQPAPERTPRKRQGGQTARRKDAGQQQRPRRRPGEKPRLKETVRSAPGSRSAKQKQLRAIRLCLLAAAAVLLILGIFFALSHSDAPQESSTSVTDIPQKGA